MRIGLFFSRANGVIDEAVDLGALVSKYSGQFFVSMCNDFFDPGDLRDLLAGISLNRLEGVLLVGESPLSYYSRRSGDVILSEIEALGINPNKIGFVFNSRYFHIVVIFVKSLTNSRQLRPGQHIQVTAPSQGGF